MPERTRNIQKSKITLPPGFIAYVSGSMRSIGTPRSMSVKSSCLLFRSNDVGLYSTNLTAKHDQLVTAVPTDKEEHKHGKQSPSDDLDIKR